MVPEFMDKFLQYKIIGKLLEDFSWKSTNENVQSWIKPEFYSFREIYEISKYLAYLKM